MARVNHIQTNFTGGEISPKLKGRVDMPRYPNAAETLENVLARIEGGAERREGQRYIASTKYGGSKRARLFRYVFSVDQAYLLEFGDFYVRFYTADGQVILKADASGPLEVVSPYSEAQLPDVKRTQGGDTMFLFHPDVPTHRLRRLTASAWSLGPVPWVAEPFAEVGHRPTARLTLSSVGPGAGITVTASPVAPAVAPTIGTAFARNAGALVQFTPPTDTGGLPIDYYEVTSSPGGVTATGTSSPIIINGLTNGVSYTFTVKAINSLGASPASLPSNAVVPSVSSGGGSLTVTITPLNFAETVDNGTHTFPGPLAATPNGTAPFLFQWQIISGNGSITLQTANQPRPSLRSSGFGTTNYCSLRCTIIDGLGAIGSLDCNVSVQHQREVAPGDGGGIPR